MGKRFGVATMTTIGVLKTRVACAVVALVGAVLPLASATGQGDPKPQSTASPVAHLHHVHLNSTDPAPAIDFYTGKFDCEKARFAGVMASGSNPYTVLLTGCNSDSDTSRRRFPQ